MHNQPEYRSKSLWQALAHIVEECGEVISAAGKSQRFGPYSVNPELPKGQQETNIDWLFREMEDVERAFNTFRKMYDERAARPRSKSGEVGSPLPVVGETRIDVE